VSDRLEERELLTRPFIKKNDTYSQAPADSMDWEPSTTRVAAAAAPKLSGGKRPMAKWVTKEEITQRGKERLCYRCGEGGHGARDCAYLPAKRPATIAVAAKESEPSRPGIEDVSESESEEDITDSEND